VHSRFAGDLGVVEHAMAAVVPGALLPGLDVLANTALLSVIDWRLALVAMLVWPLVLLRPRIFGPRATAASYSHRQAEAKLMSNLQEHLVSQPAIKAFSLEGRALGAYMAYQGTLSIGSLAAFQTLFLRLSYSLTYVTQYVPNLMKALGGMQRVKELLSETSRVKDTLRATAMPRLQDQLSPRQVSFS